VPLALLRVVRVVAKGGYFVNGVSPLYGDHPIQPPSFFLSSVRVFLPRFSRTLMV